MDDLPYKTEYAKSNRSSCKKCKCKIDKEELRIAAMVQVRNATNIFNAFKFLYFTLFEFHNFLKISLYSHLDTMEKTLTGFT